jgi:hypothetical protein
LAATVAYELLVIREFLSNLRFAICDLREHPKVVRMGDFGGADWKNLTQGRFEVLFSALEEGPG